MPRSLILLLTLTAIAISACGGSGPKTSTDIAAVTRPILTMSTAHAPTAHAPTAHAPTVPAHPRRRDRC